MKSLISKDLKKVIEELFKSRSCIPWEIVKTVEIDWKQMEVDEEGEEKYYKNFKAVPVIKITMKD